MINNIELVLSVIGSFTIGYITFKGLVWTYKRTPRISFKNPLKTYIRKEVITYLKQLKNDK